MVQFAFTLSGLFQLASLFPKRTTISPDSVVFSDVSADAWYDTAVAWTVNVQITTDADVTPFAPNASCTHGQLVTFLWRAAGMPAVDYVMDFADMPENAY